MNFGWFLIAEAAGPIERDSAINRVAFVKARWTARWTPGVRRAHPFH